MRAETVETDVLIIGGGAAGCGAALRARALGADVMMAVKGKIGRSGGTPLASLLTAPSHLPGPYPLLKSLKKLYSRISDVIKLPVPASYANAMREMLEYHYWLVDQDYFLDLALWMDKVFYPTLEATGSFVMRDEAGKPVIPVGPRNIYALRAHGLTGYLYGESRRKEVLREDIKVVEEAMAFSLLQGAGGEVAGAMVLDYVTGRLYEVVAKTTILATGHTNWLPKRSTGTREMAANGLAMALRVGAELQNMEIQWYHNSDMAHPDAWMRLHNYPNPLHGTDQFGVMVNAEGQDYMNIKECGSEIPYTIQMKMLCQQVKAGKAQWNGGNYIDFRLIDPQVFKKYQYHWEFYDKIGMNVPGDPLPCAPTWHMSAGGVRANVKTMKTDVGRLYIAGAVGGHMLGGVPIASFDGAVAGAEAAHDARRLGLPARVPDQARADEDRLSALLSEPGKGSDGRGLSPIQIKSRIREIVSDNMMFEKSEKGLNDAIGELSRVEEELVPKMRLRSASTRYNTDLVDALDVQDMLDVCRVAAHASLTRQESRGPHFREEFPFTDNDNWLKQIVVSTEGGRVKTRLVPVRQKYLRPKPGRLDYFGDPHA